MLRLQERKHKQARERDKGRCEKYSPSRRTGGDGEGGRVGGRKFLRRPLLNVPIASPDIGFYVRVQKIKSLPYF